MDVVLKTGFLKIQHSLPFQPATMGKGMKLVLANHVCHVEEHRRNGESYLIRAQVIRQTSVSEKPYETSLLLDATQQVTKGLCNCVYNKSGICKHIAALIYYVNNQESLSKTDYEQQWGKPSVRQFAKEKYAKGKSFEAMFPPANHTKNTSSKLDFSKLIDPSPYKRLLTEAARSESERAIAQLMKEMVSQVEKNIIEEYSEECARKFLDLSRETSVFSNGIFISNELEEIYKKYVVITEEDCVKLCCNTLDQALNEQWFLERNLRFSASSNIHSIKIRKKKSIQSLVSAILYPKSFDNVATKYGTRYEKHAKATYEMLYNCEVRAVGVFVSCKQPWLCASLDGVVVENNKLCRIVEFKCPYSCAKLPIVNGDKCNVQYLKVIDGQVHLKEIAKNYTQCQIQMYLSGFSECDLFVYSPAGSCCVRVKKNEKFLKNVVMKSKEFYFQYYLPALAQSEVLKKNKLNENSSVSTDDQMRRFTGFDTTNTLPLSSKKLDSI